MYSDKPLSRLERLANKTHESAFRLAGFRRVLEDRYRPEVALHLMRLESGLLAKRSAGLLALVLKEWVLCRLPGQSRRWKESPPHSRL